MIRIPISPKLLGRVLAGLALCWLGLPSVSPAQTVLEIGPSKPFAKDRWAMYPKDSVRYVEGQLVMKTNNADPQEYSVAVITMNTPDPALNFLTHDVTIQLDDLTIGGSAEPGREVFLLTLFSQVPAGGTKADTVRLRITADGGTLIGLASAGGEQKILWNTKLVLPLKRAVLTLTARGAKIELQDAEGKKSEDIPWPEKPAAWEHASPCLGLETHRDPGQGDAEATLGGIKVDSKPSAKAAK